MKPVDMERAGVIGEGDCLMACVASILEVPLASLPAITSENGARWFQIFTETLREHGYFVREQIYPPDGYAIGIGTSPREGFENHAVVTLGNEIAHDPHPTRAGVLGMSYWFVPAKFEAVQS